MRTVELFWTGSKDRWKALESYGVRVHCYVLIGNHFHLVVQTPKANLSEFMRHLNVSYTGYYNRCHRRVGHLFQGRFKAIVVEADSYLLELSRYVHPNVTVKLWLRELEGLLIS